ncbi:hypothetical protein ACFQ9X_04615 [Catenulispora yoronensis]
MTTLPMLLAAAGIGIGHAILPDHWMPLAVLARTRRYPTRRVLRLSLAAAVAHVLVSLLAGAILIAVGLRFRDTVASHTDLAVGGVLMATGLVLLVLEARGRGHGHPHPHPHGSHHHADRADHHHHHHHHSTDRAHSPAVALLERPVATATAPTPAHPHHGPHPEPHSHPEPHPRRGLLALLIPFGAVASPDLTILPSSSPPAPSARRPPSASSPSSSPPPSPR